MEQAYNSRGLAQYHCTECDGDLGSLSGHKENCTIGISLNREMRGIDTDAQLRQNISNQFRESFGNSATPLYLSNVETQAAIREAVLDERERCAKIVESYVTDLDVPQCIAEEIRKGK